MRSRHAVGAHGSARPTRFVVTALSLAQRIVALDEALATIPHAFGGALALAYYAEPRATIDIDLNLFVGAERFPDVAERLVALGAAADDPAAAELVRLDGQARVLWDTTPVDLFFAYDPFHHAGRPSTPHRALRRDLDPDPRSRAPRRVQGRVQPGEGLGRHRCDGRWRRLAVDVAEVLRWVGRIAGDDDPRFERIASVLTRR